jgi:hypothetical protein
MTLNLILRTLLLALLSQGCSKASFENIKRTALPISEGGTENSAPNSDPRSSNIGASSPQPTTEEMAPEIKRDEPTLPSPVPAASVTLVAQVSSPSIKPGKKTVLATSKFNESPDVPDVIWSIEPDPNHSDIGALAADGTYTSPSSNAKEFTVILTATLRSDPKIKASVPLIVLQDEQIFARCTRGSLAFPIIADVYELNSSATQLPNYSNPNEARKVSTVCMENYAVFPRDFSKGFPDVPALDEWFSLQTRTTLVITQAGDYEFELNSDDGARLYIDGREVIDNDGIHNAFGPGPEESLTVGHKFVTLNLAAGDHDLKLNYFQGPRLRIALELKWKVPGSLDFVYVPRESFR